MESGRAFEALVESALEDLPATFAEALSNVEVIIDENSPPTGLLGLYEGIPLTERDSGYAGVLPDRITIFRRQIERIARDESHVREIVKDTVLHEIAHHFGISDDRLHELGRD